MSRGISVLNRAEVDGQVVRPVTFVELRFDAPTGTLYLHDNIGPLTGDDWNGISRTWQGLGDLGSIDELTEGEEVSPYSLTFTLSGIDASIASQVLTDDSVLREVYVLLGFMGDDWTLVDAPHPMWRGLVDDQQVLVGKTSGIRVTAESFLAAFNQSNGRLMNDADHQSEFSGDLFYQYLPQMLDAKILWGGDTKSYRTGTAGIDFFGGGGGGIGGGGGSGFNQR